MSIDLKPCPFCGNTPSYNRYVNYNDVKGKYSDYVIVKCNCCGAMSKPVEYDSKVHGESGEYSEAKESWNTRVVDSRVKNGATIELPCIIGGEIMKDKENQNISMKEMLTKRSFEPITNCNCKIESRIDYAVRNEDKEETFDDLLNQEIEAMKYFASKNAVSMFDIVKGCEHKEKQCEYCEDLTLTELPIRSNCDLLMERFQTLIANDGEGGKEIVISHKGKTFGIRINYCPICGRKLR